MILVVYFATGYPLGWLAHVHRGLSPYNVSIGAMPNQRRLPGVLGNLAEGVGQQHPPWFFNTTL
jgi:hypothetical protein